MVPKKGYKPWNKGKKLSKNHREKIKEKLIGRAPWNKNKKLPEQHRKNIIKSLMGNKRAIGNRSKLGQKISYKTRKKISIAQTGEKNYNWRGGITPINAKIRTSIEYKLWRIAVFERDKYTCRFCGQVGGKLNADHIKPFALFPELRFAIDNGRTLCLECHKKTDTWGRRI